MKIRTFSTNQFKIGKSGHQLNQELALIIGATTLFITTLRITTFSITTLSIKGSYVTISKNDTPLSVVMMSVSFYLLLC
jgi:hypothetical protein